MISREIFTGHWVTRALNCIGAVVRCEIQYGMQYALAGIIWTTHTLVCHNYLDVYFFNANTLPWVIIWVDNIKI